MEGSDLLNLIRVAKFNEAPNKGKPMNEKNVCKNIRDRIDSSAQQRNETIIKIARYMKNEGLTLETALHFFD